MRYAVWVSYRRKPLLRPLGGSRVLLGCSRLPPDPKMNPKWTPDGQKAQKYAKIDPKIVENIAKIPSM